MTPSLWFCVPVHGRLTLTRICLRQLRRTCDTLQENGIHATAVIVGDDENLDVALELGFGTVRRDNRFLSRKFNDGIQFATERPLPPKPREPTHGQYKVVGKREYRGHQPGTTFDAVLDRNAERRAIVRGDIRLLDRYVPSLAPGSWTFPQDWDPQRAADYVVPCGSDDWVDYRLFLDLPDSRTVLGFQHISFVREDGQELTSRFLNYPGGAGIRVYPSSLMRRVGYRPADEDRKRACDTSILTNVIQATPRLTIMHGMSDPRQIVDWKSSADEQVNPYESLKAHRAVATGDPFVELADWYPAEALREMQHHTNRGADRLLPC
jgi:hypothetical protein